ncbi:hypothetical protein PG984_004351 [Apiospora sp. TS-2023a]
MAVPRIPTDQEPQTGILDFPLELLSLTFDNFRVDGDDYFPNWKELRGALKALRLTCRRLSDAATPILFSFLIIDLNKHSVRRAEELVSRNPLIAASVRKIVISLAWYQPAMADDMALFVQARLDQIDEICCDCDPDWQMLRSEVETRGRPALYESERRMPPEEIECLYNSHLIYKAWEMEEYYLDHEEDSDIDSLEEHEKYEEEAELESAIRNYRELIWRAHHAYSVKHQEQLEFVESGSFVQSIIRFLSHLRHEGLQFVITDDVETPYHESYHEDTWFINDNDQLLSAMSAPHVWSDDCVIQSGEGEVSLPVVRLLSEIPVACYRAGTPITDLTLECFPAGGQLPLLFPDAPSSSSMPEFPVELGTACQKLEKFEFSLASWLRDGDYRVPMSPQDRTDANTFLKAMLSGDKLDNLYVSPYELRHSVSNTTPESRFFDLSPTLGEINWAKVRTIRLDWFEVTQDVLEGMFRQLDRGALRSLYLQCVRLRGDGGGSWADALEVLRDRLACCEDDLFDPDIIFRSLQGGGLEKETVWEPSKPDKVAKEVKAFILGFLGENPLRCG